MKNNSFFSKYFLLIASVFLSVLTLSGCATVHHEVAPPLSEYKRPTAQEGVVVVKIVDLNKHPRIFNYISFTPEDINANDNAKFQDLFAVEPVVEGNATFAAMLKPGRYSLGSYGYDYGEGARRQFKWYYNKVDFGTFEVKAGKVTDLGTLIHYPKPSDGGYINQLIRVPNASLGQVLENHYPYFEFDKNDILTWLDDGSDDLHEASFASVAQNPLNFKYIKRKDDGSIHFLSPLGVVLIRDAKGEWHLDAVETNMLLTALDFSVANETLLGGQEGALFYKQTNDADWQNVSLSPEWTIDFIKFEASNSALLVRHNAYEISVDRITVKDGEAQVDILNKFSAKGTGWASYSQGELGGVQDGLLSRLILETTAFEVADRMFIRIVSDKSKDPYAAGFEEIVLFEVDLASFVVQPVELDKRITDFVRIDNQTVGRKLFFSVAYNQYDYFFYDETADKWNMLNRKVRWCGDHEIVTTKEYRCENGYPVKSNVIRPIGGIVRSKSNDLYTIAFIRKFLPDNRDDKTYPHIRLLKSSDEGKTWEDLNTKLPEPQCSDLIAHINGTLLLSCQGYSSDFYESTDEGKSWEHVRQQEAF